MSPTRPSRSPPGILRKDVHVKVFFHDDGIKKKPCLCLMMHIVLSKTDDNHGQINNTSVIFTVTITSQQIVNRVSRTDKNK